MRTTLEFSDTPDDKLALKRAQRADKYLHSLYEICDEIRKRRKYGEQDNISLEELSSLVHNIMQDNGIHDIYEEYDET